MECDVPRRLSGMHQASSLSLATRQAGRLLGLAMLGLASAAAPGQAQTGSNSAVTAAPAITVPRSIAGTAATQIALEIEVGPAHLLPPNCFLRVRGLPISVSLTDGHAIAPGSWAVPLFSLPNLKANLPTGQGSQSTITLQLVSVDGAVLAEAQSTFVITAPPPPRAEAPARADVLAPAPVPAGRPERALPIPRPPELSGEERQKAEKLIAHGDKFLESGNIAIARQFYQRAAEAGFAAGALRLAATYDPGELSRLKVQGVVASPADAKRWYERARELGAPEAEERLVRLGR